MQKLAIIGSGIAGMGCVYKLHNKYDITLFEKNTYLGGHTNTITIKENGRDIFIDTGFMVFNHVTYPLLTKLLADLKVETMPTDMSFSVQHVSSNLEYCGSGLNGLFAQRKNIFNPRFINMLMQINRFNKDSVNILDNPKYQSYTLKEYLLENGYHDDMIYKYLIPMSSAVWSTPVDTMLEFPAVALVRFFYNHGFLGLNTQHQWYTLKGGSRVYRDKIIGMIKDKIEINNPVVKVRRSPTGAEVFTKGGSGIKFDKVIFACHADEALSLIDEALPEEKRLLSPFKYQVNNTILHTDESIMPKNKRVWSSWNYRMENKEGSLKTSTIYWMNNLQKVSNQKNYFVSINDPKNVDPSKILFEVDYTHPIFSVTAYNAQRELQLLNQSGPLYFCGSYFRYGFHEDALMSAVELCKTL